MTAIINKIQPDLRRLSKKNYSQITELVFRPQNNQINKPPRGKSRINKIQRNFPRIVRGVRRTSKIAITSRMNII